MSKVTIDVKNDNLETVLTILENLKDGLVENIQVDKSISKKKPTYQPPKNKVIKEGEAQTGKYINPAAFKKRMSKDK